MLKRAGHAVAIVLVVIVAIAALVGLWPLLLLVIPMLMIDNFSYTVSKERWERERISTWMSLLWFLVYLLIMFVVADKFPHLLPF